MCRGIKMSSKVFREANFASEVVILFDGSDGLGAIRGFLRLLEGRCTRIERVREIDHRPKGKRLSSPGILLCKKQSSREQPIGKQNFSSSHRDLHCCRE